VLSEIESAAEIPDLDNDLLQEGSILEDELPKSVPIGIDSDHLLDTLEGIVDQALDAPKEFQTSISYPHPPNPQATSCTASAFPEQKTDVCWKRTQDFPKTARKASKAHM
jgi:hypothetical protein